MSCTSYGPTFRAVNYEGRGPSAAFPSFARPTTTFGEIDYQGDAYNRGRLAGGRSSYYRSISPGHGGRHDSDASYSREPLRRSFSTRHESSGYDADRDSSTSGPSRRYGGYAPSSGGDRLAEARAAMMRERQASSSRSSYGVDHYGRRPAVSTDPLRERASSRSYADDYRRRAAVSRTPLRDPDRGPPVSYREPRYESSRSNHILDDYWNRSDSGWSSYF
ncbi:hypothetical protein LTR17_013136 [Elasticomyces elasticus]|nr:hypothetical protein LTR17_013136 [Elasticomyces elasticus]